MWVPPFTKKVRTPEGRVFFKILGLHKWISFPSKTIRRESPLFHSVEGTSQFIKYEQSPSPTIATTQFHREGRLVWCRQVVTIGLSSTRGESPLFVTIKQVDSNESRYVERSLYRGVGCVFELVIGSDEPYDFTDPVSTGSEVVYKTGLTVGRRFCGEWQYRFNPVRGTFYSGVWWGDHSFPIRSRSLSHHDDCRTGPIVILL